MVVKIMAVKIVVVKIMVQVVTAVSFAEMAVEAMGVRRGGI